MSDNPITTQDLERLLDEKIRTHQEWGKSRIYATEVNGVENRAERVRRDIAEAEFGRIAKAADDSYHAAIEAYVDQKKRWG